MKVNAPRACLQISVKWSVSNFSHQIRYFSLYELQFEAIWLQPVIWKSMNINEHLWKLMKINEKPCESMKIDENQCKSMKVNAPRACLQISVKWSALNLSHKIRYVSLGELQFEAILLQPIIWKFMKIHGNPWKAMKSNEK